MEPRLDFYKKKSHVACVAFIIAMCALNKSTIFKFQIAIHLISVGTRGQISSCLNQISKIVLLRSEVLSQAIFENLGSVYSRLYSLAESTHICNSVLLLEKSMNTCRKKEEHVHQN